MKISKMMQLRLLAKLRFSHTSKLSDLSPVPRRLFSLSAPSSSSVELSVTPKEALLDNAPHIKVSGLQQNQKVTLWNRYIDDSGLEFSSHAHYVSNNEGKIDVRHHMSHGGKYQGIFQEGLVATMHTAPPVWTHKKKLKWARLFKKDVSSPMKYNLSLLEDHIDEDAIYSKNAAITFPLAETNFNRNLMSNGVVRHEIKEGRLRGALFTPPGDGPFPMVLDLFGAESGIKEFRSAMLASYGYASFVLPYYSYKDLPQLTNEIDLSYFLDAIEFLSSHPLASKDRVGLIGSSKGGEIGLTLCSLSEKIKACISINAYNNSIIVKFTLNGETYLEPVAAGPAICHITIDKAGKFSAWGKDRFYCWDRRNNLPVDKAHDDCYILIASGDEDGGRAWRSAVCLKDRAERFNKEKISALVYPGAGHLIDTPFHSHIDAVWNSTIYINKEEGADTKHQGMPHLYGGNPYSTTQASKDLWNRTLALFHKRLVQEAGLPVDETRLYPPYA